MGNFWVCSTPPKIPLLPKSKCLVIFCTFYPQNWCKWNQTKLTLAEIMLNEILHKFHVIYENKAISWRLKAMTFLQAIFYHLSSQIYPLKMTPQQISDGKPRAKKFYVDFKNLIGFAPALWESGQTEILFRG